MAFEFDEFEDVISDNTDTPTSKYGYDVKTYTSPLELPLDVYSNYIVEQFMTFISDCHIPVRITVFEGNNAVKTVWHDRPEVIYPLLIIESDILGFEAYIELQPPSFEIVSGSSLNGYYVATETIRDYIDPMVSNKSGKTPLTMANMTDEMTKLLAKTSTGDYHRQKGCLDSVERPLLMADRLGGLCGETPDDFEKNIFSGSNVLMEFDNCFVYINSGECTDVVIIDPTLMQYPTYPLILYILTKEVTEHLEKEHRKRELIWTMLERLDIKPTLIFHTENKVVRGHNIFCASDIYRAFNPAGECHRLALLLRFHGIYTYTETDKFGRKILQRTPATKFSFGSDVSD